MTDSGPVLEFRLPDLGEGLTDAEIVAWHVAVGDTVELNQTIAEVETAKAVVELPSPFSGIVTELLAEPGETVPVGRPIIKVASDLPPARPEPVLVGYGPADLPESRRRGRTFATPVEGGPRPDAKPSARKLARELGVDLNEVPYRGRAITPEDVAAAADAAVGEASARSRETDAGGPASDAAGGAIGSVGAIPGSSDAFQAPPGTTYQRVHVTTPEQPRETRTKVSGVRKRTADAMALSARTIPAVTEFVTVDVTASIDLLEHLKDTASFDGLKLTPLALVAKTAVLALADHPALNSAWDEERQEIVTRHYVNLGLAVATDRGLLVPSVKDAHAMNLRELVREMTWLVESARKGDATPVDLRGGTFSITNIGVFGIDAGTPMIYPGQAAILCLGAVRKQPWVFRDQIAIRWVTTLALSFDHRLVDGEQGSKFLADLAVMLEDPLALLGRV